MNKKRLVNKLVKAADGTIVCVYSKKYKIFAWDVAIPEDKIKLARKIIKNHD